MKIKCLNCQQSYDYNDMPNLCTCGSPLVFTDRKTINVANLDDGRWDIYRYYAAMNLPVDIDVDSATLGEGMTAIIRDSEADQVFYKQEFVMPTGSFKDRGASVLIGYAKQMGYNKVIQDSSGNAGAAVAAYCARAGIDCDIYVPGATAATKIKQIAAYGAKVIRIDGDREATAAAALMRAKTDDVFYASHVYNPLFHEGTMTYALEVYEQWRGELPDFVVPVGNGTLLLGVFLGLSTLKNSGLIDHYPRIIAIQSANCAPIYEAFYGHAHPDKRAATLAEGIAIADPKRARQIIAAIHQTNGAIYTASESGIAHYKDYLSQQGLYVEPTTAATVAGYFENRPAIGADGEVIIPLCGSGLKK